jgi:4-amino-4-deoxy-L-arabinose transferase-like glycosyltransferase
MEFYLKTRFWKWMLPALLIGAAAIMILTNLDRNHLWQDEAQTALISRSVLNRGIPRCSDGENSFSQELSAECSSTGIYKWHPWLPFYLHAAFFKLLGQSDFVARLPDALFGIGTVFLVFWTMQSAGRGTRPALVAALVLLLMVPFLLLSRQCRYYSMAAFFSIGAIGFYFRLLNSAKRMRTLLVAATVFLFYTQIFYGAILLGAIAMHAVCMSKDAIRKLAAPVSAIILCVLPWLLYASDISHRSVYRSTFLNVDVAIPNLKMFLNQLGYYVIPLSLLLFLLLAMLWRRRQGLRDFPKPDSLVSFLLLYAALSLVALSLVVPNSFFRYLAPLLPVCAMLSAEIIEYGFRIKPVWGFAGLLIFIINQPLHSYFYELTHDFRGPVEGMVSYFRQHARPDDVIAITYDDLPIKWYTDLRVIGGLTGESLAEAGRARWIVLRKHIICEKDSAVANYLIRNVPWARYARIVLDAPDTRYENREDPQLHLYRTASREDRVIIYERIPE